MKNLSKNRSLMVHKESECVYCLDFQGGSEDKVAFTWDFPCIDIETVWCPADRARMFLRKKFQTRFSGKTPLIIYCDNRGDAVYTVALSEVRREAEMFFTVVEETACIKGEVSVDISELGPNDYSVKVYIDDTKQPLYEACEKVVKWWEEAADTKHCPVPEVAYQPLYSTWYSFHQDFTAAQLEDECKRAKELGMDVIITDDGWQTDDIGRGYAYCGDWNVSSRKIPDMKQHVANVHKLGMKYILWYSVPFVGICSESWKRFEDKLLYTDMNRGKTRGILDPRYPEVREYIISTYENALKDWDLDGFKLDFIQYFYKVDDTIPEGADYVSVQDATEKLVSDIYTRLSALRPEVLIECRQLYAGPAMKKYANIFRVSDCANNYLVNREGIAELRLLGNTAVHSDMLMWNVEDSAENAALQLLNSIFGVIQFSMRIDRLPERQRKMSAFWLKYAKENQDILLHGRFRPFEEQSNFPVIRSDLGDRSVIAVYAPGRVVDTEGVRDVTVINATYDGEVFVKVSCGFKSDLTVYDCTGELVRQERISLKPGVNTIPVPRSGYVQLVRV